MSCLNLLILSLKKAICVLQKIVEYKWGGTESGGLTILLNSENRDLVLHSREQNIVK